MSIAQSVCDLVKLHWDELYPNSHAAESLVFLKVAGKASPNASIIAMILDARSQRPVAVAKIPRNPQLSQGLEREYMAMVDLRESISDVSILDRVPYRGMMVEVEGIKILLQTAATGHPMVREMISRESVESLYGKILPWMFAFHTDGAEECVLEGEMLRELIESPIARFVEQFSNAYNRTLSDEAQRYLLELPRKVEGRTVCLCRQHGDFNAHNTLVKLDNGQLSDFALIDWEDYRPQRLPIHDLNHFFTSNSKVVGLGISADDSYEKFLLKDGWYCDLYLKAVADYEARGVIDKETFLMLSPLYLVEMCLQMSDVQRQQQDTSSTWLRRVNTYIDRFCSEEA